MTMSSAHKAHPNQQVIKKRTKGEGGIRKRENGWRANENLEKRKRSLFRKYNETVELYNPDIYIAVRRKGKCTVYSTRVAWLASRHTLSLFFNLAACHPHSTHSIPILLGHGYIEENASSLPPPVLIFATSLPPPIPSGFTLYLVLPVSIMSG
jgi:hypothetical protein